MFAVCPKCDHALPPAQRAGAESCPACGLIFRKYVAAQNAPAAVPSRRAAFAIEEDDAPRYDSRVEAFFARILELPSEGRSTRLVAGAVFWVLLAILAVRYARWDIALYDEMPAGFLHIPMVPFHEFGHLLFRPLGEFMGVAGGSLTQFLMPLGFGIYFVIWKRDNLAGWLMLWWEGLEWVDLAPYCYDAKIPTMTLLSGRTGDTGGHDYIEILGTLGLLNQARGVGHLMQAFGVLLMVLALAWGAAFLWKLWESRDEKGFH